MTYDERGLRVDDDDLAQYAENVARAIKPDARGGGRADAAALRASLRRLEARRDALSLQWSGLPAAPGAVRWLLDNAYLVRMEGAAAARELHAADALRTADGESVLMRLCRAFVSVSRSPLSDERLAAFLSGFQRALILDGAELSLLICGMKAAVVHALAALFCESADLSERTAEAEAERLITALRELGVRDLRRILEAADAVEQALRRDPAGVYPKMSERSRAEYRRALTRLARRRGLQEHTAAQRVLSLAQSGSGERAHVGWWIVRAPLGETPRRRDGGGYIALHTLLTLTLTLLAGFSARSAAVALLLLIPVSELVKQAMDAIALRAAEPTILPRLSLDGGVPDEGRTLCAVSALLTDEEGARALVRSLEDLALLSRDAGAALSFALLADLPDSAIETDNEQAKKALDSASEGVAALNAKYGGGFYLLTRPRVRSAEGRFQGWERKRGALLETMRLLRALPSSVYAAEGGALPEGVRYLILLDSDTRMPPGAAREMIGAMLHPLCRPVVDPVRGVVTEGHALLAPRLGTELSAANRTDFSRIFGGPGGTDPYGGACSELYMDLFGRGGFAGKGIVDIDAYLQCMGDRVPENLMLSHDAVEGAFLRCGWLGDVELSDGFPGSVRAYLRRLERWTRGDWQNLHWALRRGRVLPELERWKLLDSLRRSLVPVSTLTALAVGLFSGAPGLRLAAVAAALAAACELLLTAAHALTLRDEERRVRYRSALFVGVGGGLVRTLLRLLLLPAEAMVCAGGALRALWRMLVSRRNLLEWQTAAQSERAGGGLVGSYRSFWLGPLLGVLLLAFSPNVIGKAVGVLWLLSPLCAVLLSLPAEVPLALRDGERRYLTEVARDTWRWFDAHLSPAGHWLPPDNVQVRPPAPVAMRTSPTNIGLSLLAVLAAADLGFTAPEDALKRIAAGLGTLDALPKWRGHIYNWYRTDDLSPLMPRYVSTVDSGNLCACLIALRHGLEEYGATDAALLAGRLAADMDFSALYDAERRLFVIGLSPERPEKPKAWYDLMASEARLTAYLAVARGDVPRAHWRRLSRALLQCGPYRGMASWTGTMFEYLMPELLLPLRKNGMFWESARFCVYAQRRRVRGSGLPWGVSESCFAALDSAMHYRYKAHGCGRLALKPGMDDELVLSPYSAFLALAVRPHAAIADLRAFEAQGMRGEYGFWEALDCTRADAEGRPRVVESVMAHHAGMSLIAAANLLTGGAMQRRFTAEPAMRAYLDLLSERVPVGGAVLRSAGGPRVRPARPQRSVLWSAEGSGADLRPCALLASESYSLLLGAGGLSRARWGQLAPYVSPYSPLDAERGVSLCFEDGNGCVSLYPEPGCAEDAWRLSADRVRYRVLRGSFSAETEVSLAGRDVGERRRVTLRSGGEALSGTLTLRFRPLLAKETDRRSHPAFWGLGLSARTEDGALLLRRLPRGGQRELWLCVASDRPCAFDLAPGADSGRADRRVLAGETERFLSDPLVSARCALFTAPGGQAAVCFALAMAYTAADAHRAALDLLSGDDTADLPRRAAAVLSLTSADVGAAMAMLPRLCFPTAPRACVKQSALWRFGVSGDLPIVVMRYGGETELEAARRLMDLHLFLSACGCPFDLVFLSKDGASYHAPMRTALSDALRRAGGELLRDHDGGVHLIEDGEEAAALEDAAALITPLESALRVSSGGSSLPRPQLLSHPPQVPVRFVWREDAFEYYVNRSLPPRAWSIPLTNGRFGYLATDCGTGHMWYGNARECQLSPWLGLPHATEGPERLVLDSGAERVSLFASPEDRDCRVRFLPGAAVWEKTVGERRVRLTAFVPHDADCRVLLIERERPAPDEALRWRLDLRLASRIEDARFCFTERLADGLRAANARGDCPDLLCFCTGGIRGFTCSRASALAGRYDGACGFAAESVFALELPAAEASVLVCGCGDPEKLRALTEPAAARAALRETLRRWDAVCGRLTLRSPVPALDHYVNRWAIYQTLACRIMARCSVYQSGGAYGFRDQLQDAVNLIPFDPAPARAQILRCCARQYAEGDVQHWWHETGAGARGIRSRCSDDLLWLPWAVCEYVEKTGDRSVLGEQLPYLLSPPLRPEERDRYEAPRRGEKPESVLRHCARAIARVMDRGCGAHGLLRMGSGDWNDGFDTMGGESVWLSWFFLHVADRFTRLCGDDDASLAPPAAFLEALAAAANAAWDGKHFLRGWYADGRPLGSDRDAACRIDSVAQSWAALSGRADPEKAKRALTDAYERLYDRHHQLVKLFDPPFDGADGGPGYLTSYGPGFRENGGQYTHAAVWLAMALLRQDRRAEAWELLSALLPGAKDAARYRCEPFVLAADVRSAAESEGEGGWSWYTGAAGWLLRAVTEELYGLRLEGGKLCCAPRLPQALLPSTMVYKGKTLRFCSDVPDIS